jgi:hypothetical protein
MILDFSNKEWILCAYGEKFNVGNPIDIFYKESNNIGKKMTVNISSHRVETKSGNARLARLICLEAGINRSNKKYHRLNKSNKK